MDTLKKLGSGNAEPATKDNAPVYRESFNILIDKLNELISKGILNELDTFTTTQKITNLVSLTQEQYDALTTTAGVMYVIVAED